MNKRLLTIIGVATLLCLLLLAWRLPQKSAYMNTSADTDQVSSSPVAEENSAQPTAEAPATTTRPAAKPTATPIKNGQYIDYSAEVIAKTTGTKVLFFHAPWCPQCRALEASIQAGPIPSNVSIIKVDYDTNQTLRQKHGVTIQTTLVRVDDSGNLLKKYSAYNTPTLESLKANVL